MYKKIILGSGSPRRKELLNSIFDGQIEVIKSDVEEIYPEDLPLEKIPEYLCELKATDLLNKINLQNSILITADTIVLLKEEVLGKPKDKADAKKMLQKLSGSMHLVITGVGIFSQEKKQLFSEVTEVYFAPIDDAVIDDYTERFQPLDKAGSYGIQEFMGMIGIEKINGCYYNVMGLPTSRVYRELNRF